MQKHATLHAIVVSATLLLAAGGARAQSATAKCDAAKIKCASDLAAALLGCHRKAESKNVELDPVCVDKSQTTFSDPVTGEGCMEKAEEKPPCLAVGDADALAAFVDAFVEDVVTDMDPDYPTPVLDRCGAGKKKCVSNKVKALLGCYRKDLIKPDPLKFQPCVTKAVKKFDGGADPAKGCFEKLEAKYAPASTMPCQTFDDTAAVEAKVDDFVVGVASHGDPPPVPTTLDFTLNAPGGVCGETRDGGGNVIALILCGSLGFGGGGGVVPASPVPEGSTSRFLLTCAGTSCTVHATASPPPAGLTPSPIARTPGVHSARRSRSRIRPSPPSRRAC